MSERLRSNLFLLALAVLLILMYLLRRVVLLIYVSIIFAVIFTPIVEYIQRIRIVKWSPGKGAAILILLLVLAVAVSLFLVFAAPRIMNDSQDLAASLPSRIGQLQDRMRALPFGDAIAGKLQLGHLESYAGKLAQSVFAIFKGLAGGLTAMLTLALLTAYFILDGARSFHWFLSMVPRPHRGRLEQTLRRATARAQKWLLGQAILMLILGTCSAIVFGLLGISYFFVLAVFAGLANFVPVLGPIVTVILAGLVALLDSVTKFIGVLIFYAVYQQVENAYLTPRIMKSSVHLSALAVIVALAIGGEAAGVMGAMVAVPTAAIISTLANEYLVRDRPEQQERLRAA
ncbi:MAG TPA: AI-2E family transporter [Candidatus Limnocylindrales bacterium]|nr:AI-2E family transporter [Candidatus Limnocylindrales bacterium]